jgi:sirohydrochlorin cobaltochelatase
VSGRARSVAWRMLDTGMGGLAAIGAHCAPSRAAVRTLRAIARSQVRYNSGMDPSSMLIVVAHGSRAEGTPEAHAQLCAEIERRLGVPVSGAFLEITPPDIPSAIDAAVARGATGIVLLPYFLLAGNHTTRDIPEIMERARAAHPGIRVTMTAPVGPDPRLVDICVARAVAAGAGAPAGGA